MAFSPEISSMKSAVENPIGVIGFPIPVWISFQNCFTLKSSQKSSHTIYKIVLLWSRKIKVFLTEHWTVLYVFLWMQDRHTKIWTKKIRQAKLAVTEGRICVIRPDVIADAFEIITDNLQNCFTLKSSQTICKIVLLWNRHRQFAKLFYFHRQFANNLQNCFTFTDNLQTICKIVLLTYFWNWGT